MWILRIDKQKIMKKIFIYIIIAAGLGVTGCEEDLNIPNPNQPTVEQFWQNASHAEQGVNAIYSTFHRGPISRWMPFLYILRSDVGRSLSPAPPIVNNTDRFLQTDYNAGETAGVWKDLYIGIFRANQALSKVPGIDMDEALKERLLGEAYFMRGLFYFHLASLWGNVPLILEPSRPEMLPATSSREQVWAQVEQDLTVAAEKLPPSHANSANIGRATKGAAKAYLAKAYMQQHKFNEASKPLEWLVEGPGAGIYDLVADYRDNFLVTTENNQESVFEWQFEVNPSEYTDNDIQTPNHNYGTSLAQFFAPSGIGWSDGEARPWVVNEFLGEQTIGGERDPRLAASFLYENTDPRGPDFTMIYGMTFTERYGVNDRVWFRKFLNDHWKNEEGYRSPNNWRVVRYADILLMYAETLNELGRTADAYQYVDRVRQRVDLPALSDIMPGLTQDQFLEQLKHERLLELAGEGHRWNDLARWGDLGPNLSDRDPHFENFVIGKHELLPVPQRDLDINPNLDQNPNW